jgi:hypothetical protein
MQFLAQKARSAWVRPYLSECYCGLSFLNHFFFGHPGKMDTSVGNKARIKA